VGPSKSFRGVLYELKKQFGVPGGLYKTTNSSADLATGKISKTRVKYGIRRIIDLPQSLLTTKIYALSFIAANKNFTYGGYFDKDSKFFLLDQLDLPKGVVVEGEDFLIVKHQRFEIKNVETMEFDLGYVIVANKVAGQPTDEVHEVSVYQSIRFGQSAVPTDLVALADAMHPSLEVEVSNAGTA